MGRWKLIAEPIPYKEAFPKGTEVRIADPAFLKQFAETWKDHHKLQAEQLSFADRVTKVVGVAFYHGGDPLYTLERVPGLWHEQCLRTTQLQIAVVSVAPATAGVRLLPLEVAER